MVGHNDRLVLERVRLRRKVPGREILKINLWRGVAQLGLARLLWEQEVPSSIQFSLPYSRNRKIYGR